MTFIDSIRKLLIEDDITWVKTHSLELSNIKEAEKKSAFYFFQLLILAKCFLIFERDNCSKERNVIFDNFLVTLDITDKEVADHELLLEKYNHFSLFFFPEEKYKEYISQVWSKVFPALMNSVDDDQQTREAFAHLFTNIHQIREQILRKKNNLLEEQEKFIESERRISSIINKIGEKISYEAKRHLIIYDSIIRVNISENDGQIHAGQIYGWGELRTVFYKKNYVFTTQNDERLVVMQGMHSHETLKKYNLELEKIKTGNFNINDIRLKKENLIHYLKSEMPWIINVYKRKKRKFISDLIATVNDHFCEVVSLKIREAKAHQFNSIQLKQSRQQRHDEFGEYATHAYVQLPKKKWFVHSSYIHFAKHFFNNDILRLNREGFLLEGTFNADDKIKIEAIISSQNVILKNFRIYQELLKNFEEKLASNCGLFSLSEISENYKKLLDAKDLIIVQFKRAIKKSLFLSPSEAYLNKFYDDIMTNVIRSHFELNVQPSFMSYCNYLSDKFPFAYSVINDHLQGTGGVLKNAKPESAYFIDHVTSGQSVNLADVNGSFGSESTLVTYLIRYCFPIEGNEDFRKNIVKFFLNKTDIKIHLPDLFIMRLTDERAKAFDFLSLLLDEFEQEAVALCESLKQGNTVTSSQEFPEQYVDRFTDLSQKASIILQFINSQQHQHREQIFYQLKERIDKIITIINRPKIYKDAFNELKKQSTETGPRFLIRIGCDLLILYNSAYKNNAIDTLFVRNNSTHPFVQQNILSKIASAIKEIAIFEISQENYIDKFNAFSSVLSGVEFGTVFDIDNFTIPTTLEKGKLYALLMLSHLLTNRDVQTTYAGFEDKLKLLICQLKITLFEILNQLKSTEFNPKLSGVLLKTITEHVFPLFSCHKINYLDDLTDLQSNHIETSQEFKNFFNDLLKLGGAYTGSLWFIRQSSLILNPIRCNVSNKMSAHSHQYNQTIPEVLIFRKNILDMEPTEFDSNFISNGQKGKEVTKFIVRMARIFSHMSTLLSPEQKYGLIEKDVTLKKIKAFIDTSGKPYQRKLFDNLIKNDNQKIPECKDNIEHQIQEYLVTHSGKPHFYPTNLTKLKNKVVKWMINRENTFDLNEFMKNPELSMKIIYSDILFPQAVSKYPERNRSRICFLAYVSAVTELYCLGIVEKESLEDIARYSDKLKEINNSISNGDDEFNKLFGNLCSNISNALTTKKFKKIS